ncbi:MAG TPA: histidine phosphatase family protein [Propionibacteriaceae bacterium]|nr:histidine phosphatase family protein [Propionibacteriaceae bacterium]
MAQRLLVVAHAPTAATPALVFGDAGEPQTQEIRRLNGRVASWFSGPEKVCRVTTAHLGGEAEPVAELRECDFGAWTGRTLVDVASSDAGGLETWLRDLHATPHGGESLTQLINRVGRVLDDHPWPAGRSVAVVSPLVARAAAVHALAAQPEVIFHIDIAPLGRLVISRSDRIWRLRSLAATPKDQFK